MWWTTAFRMMDMGFSWDEVLKLLKDRQECVATQEAAQQGRDGS